jgi:hypothetical protein
MLGPVEVLEQREEFLESVREIARLCYWSDQDINELSNKLWDDLVKIDNDMFVTYERTRDRKLAYRQWETQTEDLRRWLSLILGIKITYV